MPEHGLALNQGQRLARESAGSVSGWNNANAGSIKVHDFWAGKLL
jgi:hypothetical protein